MFGLVAIVAALGVCELVLRAAGLGNPILIEPDQAAGYILKPEQNLHRFGGVVRTNSYGMRSEEVPASRPPGVFRLLLVGDSYTYGTTSVDQSHIFAELLHKELPALIHKPVEVFAAAAGGWAIANELGYARSRGLFDADLVLLVLNDGDPDQPFATYEEQGSTPSVDHHPSFALQEVWERYLKSRLFPDKSAEGAEQPTADEERRVAAQNLAHLDQLLQLTRAAKIPLAVAYIPKPTATASPSGLVAWCASRQVPLINLASATSQWKSDDVLLHDHVHYNAKGNRLIATELEKDWRIVMPAAGKSAQSAHP